MNVATEPDNETPGIANALIAYKWSIIFLTLVALAAGLLLSSRQQPVYESQARVLVQPIVPPAGLEGQLAEINLATERELAQSVAVGNIAADNLGLSEPLRDLMSGLEVETPLETEIISFSYRHTDPEVAKDRAQAFAAAYLEYRQSTAKAEFSSSAKKIEEELAVLNQRLAELNAQIQQADIAGRAALQGSANFILELIVERQLVQLGTDEGNVGQLFQPAALPTSPVSPDPVRNGGLSIVVGLILGVSQALARSTLKSAKPAPVREPEEAMPKPLEIPEPSIAGSPTVKKLPSTRSTVTTRPEPRMQEPQETPAGLQTRPHSANEIPAVQKEPIARDQRESPVGPSSPSTTRVPNVRPGRSTRDRSVSPEAVDSSRSSTSEFPALQSYPVTRERQEARSDSESGTGSAYEGHVRKTKSSPPRSEASTSTERDSRGDLSPDERKARESLFWASREDQGPPDEDQESPLDRRE